MKRTSIHHVERTPQRQPSRVARPFAALMLTAAIITSVAQESFQLNESDVVAFIGGGDVAAAQHTGQIESLLAARFPMARYRNFGWEGDTVFAQPRDLNFPPLIEHLRKAGVTLAFVQFGRTEALSEDRADFAARYRKVLTEIQTVVPDLILVTPVPFENPGQPLPDLSKRNEMLLKISETISAVAKEKELLMVDLFDSLRNGTNRLTDDGLQLTSFGHAVVANVFAEALGLGREQSAGKDGKWQNAKFEALRNVIIAKNRLWFDYWRPHNWAFLGGDRTEQPSSRDHRDPTVRWFPAEMKKFPALISEKESEISRLVEEMK